MKINLENKKIYIFLVIFFLFFTLFLCFLYYIYQENDYRNIELDIKNNIVRKSFVEGKKLVEKQQSEQKFLASLDLKTDSSLTKFVSAKVPFNNKKYIPESLVNISTGYIIDGKGGGQKLRKEALVALKKMVDAYYKDTGEKIVVVSAYRSYLYQKGIKDRGCPDNLCAKAGYSEHQSGLAVDLWAASSNKAWQNKIFKQRYKWLKENAYKYGFHNTYQKGIGIDTYEIEPWHWRYLGEPLARYLWKNNMTFAELYNKMEQH